MTEKRYALYVSENTIKYPPKIYKSADKSFICFNFDKASPEILNSRGYYEVVETNSIEDVQDETHYARPTYSLGDEQILCTYVAEELAEEQE